jgi:hypothetical protein
MERLLAKQKEWKRRKKGGGTIKNMPVLERQQYLRHLLISSPREKKKGHATCTSMGAAASK